MMTSVTIHQFFDNDRLDLPALSSYLDRLERSVRIRQIRSLRAREQASLFDAAKDYLPIQVEHFVPAGKSVFQEVVHFGRNSLPALYIFEKRFCLPDVDSGDLWGYNEQSLKGLTGPGYFIARQDSKFEFVIDYNEVPPSKPVSWPAVLPNSSRLGRFIYFGTRDFVRRVSEHVTIGRATREGKPLDNWFILCRDD